MFEVRPYDVLMMTGKNLNDYETAYQILLSCSDITHDELQKLSQSDFDEIYKVFLKANPFFDEKKSGAELPEHVKDALEKRSKKNIFRTVCNLISVGHHDAINYGWSWFLEAADFHFGKKK